MCSGKTLRIALGLALLCLASVAASDQRLKLRVRTHGTGAAAGLITCAQLGVTCVFETSFTTAQGWTADKTQTACGGTGFGNSSGGFFQTGVADWGGWTTTAGSCAQINTAANFGSGAGGRGYRHWRGDDHQNDDDGALYMDFKSLAAGAGRQTEWWHRFVMRYQSGFAWSGSNPQYAKDVYWTPGDTGQGEFGIQGTGWSLHSYGGGGTNITTTKTWAGLMGSATGDGLWHCIEFHAKQNTTTGPANGTGEVWVDDVLVAQNTAWDWDTSGSSADWDWWLVGENQHLPSNGGADKYTDYDDYAVSLTSRIGGCSGFPKS